MTGTEGSCQGEIEKEILPRIGTDGGAGEGAIQIICSVAAGKGGVNSGMAPPPAATRVTLTDYSVSSALITLQRPPPAAPQTAPAPAPGNQYQKAHTENPQPTPSKAWTLKNTEEQSRRDLGDQFLPWTGCSLGQKWYPSHLGIPCPIIGLDKDQEDSKSLQSE